MSTATALVVVLAAGALTVVVTMGVTALVARRLDRVAVVDIAWGAGFAVVALVTAGMAQVLGHGTAWRRWLVAAMVVTWGLRLAWHLRRRAGGEHRGAEDPRYTAMLGGSLSEVGLPTVVRRVFAVQGAALWFVAIPVMTGALLTASWWPAVVAGVLVWAVGLVFEVVGDAQLAAHKRLPRDERPQVLDTGLWRYTRHPNYFGDALVWWGVWLAAGVGSSWVAALATVACPALMTLVLVRVTGARLLERTMMTRPGYPEYAARTSMFIPLPPRGGRPTG